ncbi:spore germination protein [Bacillus sonorensis]|uniref:Spore germination protein n=2 Tax=Bacillus sonorensis TaxID=119858 RepID=M5P9C2_9BACI|nr:MULTISPECIES: spore germination protein [Bacillus]TWK72787.1 putative spore germination protein GerPA [Bacillus paralicheniformis]ASB90179.1 putative spore germination protein GerPA [Bacillus sonorensis]EME76049.1 spore germination protein [Bacillus sonorensis L12]MBG9916625.1 spore gernimation protein GerPA [Bacillus sonorensis]MCF7619420.1 spore germination protein [Bacillus sonorensis]
MPAIVGAFKVNAVGSSGVVHIGDCITISPYSELKTFAGAGSFITGDGTVIYNQNSITRTFDNDLIDQPVAGNL